MIKNIYFGVILKKTGHLNNEKYFEKEFILYLPTPGVYIQRHKQNKSDVFMSSFCIV